MCTRIFVSESRKVTRHTFTTPANQCEKKLSSRVTFLPSPSNTSIQDQSGACVTPDSGLWDGIRAGQNGGNTIHCMPPDDTIEMLMARYQQGDFAAASALIDRVSPQLYRFFAAQSFSRHDADDLLQETWLRIHKVRHTWRTGEPAMPWFYAIARHIRVDHFRKSLRTATGEQKLEAMSASLSTIPTHSDQTEQIAALLAPLSAAEREVLEMLKVAGMSLEEVAGATSSSVGSVKQKVHRAYKKLRKTLSSEKKGGRL
jgi:RNA polymerase sigma-70 factor (ECF subfamily)